MTQQGRAAVVSITRRRIGSRVRAMVRSKAEVNSFFPTKFLPITIAERTRHDASKSNDLIYNLQDDNQSKRNRLVEW